MAYRDQVCFMTGKLMIKFYNFVITLIKNFLIYQKPKKNIKLLLKKCDKKSSNLIR